MHIPLPPDETERLLALQSYQILDTPPEAAFDRITTLTAQLFNLPFVFVTFIDTNRQWFKACLGFEIGESPRELTFCTHAILSDSVMIVPDALADPRFAQNPVVTGPPHIRFYVGAPIKGRSGHILGTLCALGTTPQQFDDEQCKILSNLAAIVMDELELRQTARELRESEAHLRQVSQRNNQLAVAINSLTSGVLVTDPTLPDNPIIFVNPAETVISGYSEEEALGRNCRFLQGPETDRATVRRISDALKQRRPFCGVIQNYRKDGTPFLNELTVCPVFDDNGQLINFVGLQTDVTEREQAREELQRAKAAAERANQVLEQRVRERTDDLAQSQIEILKRLARAAEFRDDDTGKHTQRVALTAALLAQALGLPMHQVTLIQQAAPLHDVGKIAISDLILLKAGKLTEAEIELMKTHADKGAKLLAGGRSEVVRLAERIAGSHHERWDGKGYPERLVGEAIPLEGRILAIADVFDALTHGRPYKKAWPLADAVAEITRQSGLQFDPRLVEAFLTLPHETLL